MRMRKDFDCVEMKNRIQEKLQQERAGLTDDEIGAQVEEGLETSQTPIAQLWRRIRQKKDMQSSVSEAVSH